MARPQYGTGFPYHTSPQSWEGQLQEARPYDMLHQDNARYGAHPGGGVNGFHLMVDQCRIQHASVFEG